MRRKDAPSYTKIAGTNPKECCLVEDLLSGLAVLQSLNCDVFVLHGTNIDPTLMHRIAGAYDRAIVWLDNDSDHVCHQAELMERTIKMYSNTIETERVLSLSDPKKFTKHEIWEAINGLN